MNKVRDIPGYEGIYAATSCGKIWSYRRKIFLKPSLANGYAIVGLRKDDKQKTWKVHRLVALAYIDNPENKPEVNHKDGCRTNNCVNNLEWVTSKENIAQANFKGKSKCFSRILCVETGIIYKSCADAGRSIGIHPYGINSVLNGRQKTAGGYHWERYYEKDKNEETENNRSN